MTTDDEPMLSQPADNSTPMISGRATKIITDTRGAYLAGNLDALIDQMSDQQKQRFHHALTQQALWAARQTLVEGDTEAKLAAVDWIERWLANPIPENSGGALPALLAEAIEDHPIDEDVTRWCWAWLLTGKAILCAARLIQPDVIERGLSGWIKRSVTHATDAVVEAAIITHRAQYRIYKAAAKQAAHHWQLEAAWAILQGKEPPALKPISCA